MAYRPDYESADYKAGFEDGEYAATTAITLARAKERNFCERCGKRRGGDVNYIHTCTPPARGRMFDYKGQKVQDDNT